MIVQYYIYFSVIFRSTYRKSGKEKTLKKLKCKNRNYMTSKMSIQGLLPKKREHWFPESRHHLLTIVLVETMLIMWRRFPEAGSPLVPYGRIFFPRL